MTSELRWQQRLSNLNKAFVRLQKACAQTQFNELESAGLVQFYEFTFELCWKTLKDLLLFEGYEVSSPRQTLKKAFEMGLIDNIDLWLKALESRNLFTHTYDDTIAKESIDLIRQEFLAIMTSCVHTINNRYPLS